MAEQLSPRAQKSALEKIQTLEMQKKNSKAKSSASKSDLMEKVILGGASFGLGALKSRYVAERKPLPTVLGIPPNLLYAGVALGASQYTKGITKKVACGVTDAIIGIMAYEFGREKGNPGGPLAVAAAEDAEAWVAGLKHAGKSDHDVQSSVDSVMATQQAEVTAAGTAGGAAAAGPRTPAAGH